MTDLIVEITPQKVVELIMAQHWDMVACGCWICESGRKNGLGAYSENLPHNLEKPFGFVRIDGEWMEKGNDAWGRKKA